MHVINSRDWIYKLGTSIYCIKKYKRCYLYAWYPKRILISRDSKVWLAAKFQNARVMAHNLILIIMNLLHLQMFGNWLKVNEASQQKRTSRLIELFGCSDQPIQRFGELGRMNMVVVPECQTLGSRRANKLSYDNCAQTLESWLTNKLSYDNSATIR